MGWRDRMRGALRGLAGNADGEGGIAAAQAVARKTLALPMVLTPFRPGGAAVPKPTAANLRRFAEMPVARRAINLVKDRIASMDWQLQLKRDAEGDVDLERLRVLRRCFEAPNPGDSFRTFVEQVLEDILVGGYGAAEMELTGDDAAPVRLWPVDGATVQVHGRWDGDASTPRYTQSNGLASTPLLDTELMYVRLNPRTYTAYGLGRLEVAFEAIGQFLQANRYAARLASSTASQYALWMGELTTEQHERVVGWWRDEVEGTGQVPILSTGTKPEVLRFAGGTDADMRLQWQEFLLRMIANAFDLPPMMLGLESDVNRATATEMADEAFESAVKPLAKLLAEHLTRDVLGKRLGLTEVEFVFNDLLARDDSSEVTVQVELLKAGVLTVDEVRSMRGLGPLDAARKEVEA